MAKRLNSALAQYLGPLSDQAEDENIGHVLLHNRAAAETFNSSHVFEISLPVLSVVVFLPKTVYSLDCRTVVFVAAESSVSRHTVLAQRCCST